ncbi:MAG TPA: NAD(P)/FAD-dependent oxidoreductase [Vicinamibacterales bacterium]
MPNQSDDSGACDVIVVGAGAAGLATAIFGRRFNPHRRVLLLEGAKKPGAKILVSGGSRCNVTNRTVDERDFWGGRGTIVRNVLRAFTATDAIDWFRDLGVALHEEPGGKMFPDSNQSREVLDALLREASTRGVTLLASHRVVDLRRSDVGFTVDTAHGAFSAPAVVIATGGRSLPKTGSDGAAYEIVRRLGHTIVPTTAALAPLVLDDRESIHREVTGVSQDVRLDVWIDGVIRTRLEGSLLWTHIGASGPVAMNASRHWLRAELEGQAVSITLSFCAGATFEEIDARLLRLAQESPRMTAQSMLCRFVPASVAAAMLGRLSIGSTAPVAHLARDERRRLTHALVEWPLPVVATRGYNFAEATAGGVALDEIDPSTMESRLCAGLFLVGEVLDVDGRIGGFNFQWAWSSGFVAGRALARRD